MLQRWFLKREHWRGLGRSSVDLTARSRSVIPGRILRGLGRPLCVAHCGPFVFLVPL